LSLRDLVSIDQEFYPIGDRGELAKQAQPRSLQGAAQAGSGGGAAGGIGLRLHRGIGGGDQFRVGIKPGEGAQERDTAGFIE
jgi:hypothetical protein